MSQGLGDELWLVISNRVFKIKRFGKQRILIKSCEKLSCDSHMRIQGLGTQADPMIILAMVIRVHGILQVQAAPTILVVEFMVHQD